MSYCLHVRREELRFSAAHFTLFPDGTAERLHGHNYLVSLELHGDEAPYGLLLNFHEFKEVVRELCGEMDERMLVPTANPDLDVRDEGGQLEVRWKDRLYSFPREDVLLLPLANVTVEELARHLAGRLHERLGARLREARVREFVLGVEESPGQGARYLAAP
jgi:6-pyruvoyltetrahydropterin/6-carboxytetrahydropterin synthase